MKNDSFIKNLEGIEKILENTNEEFESKGIFLKEIEDMELTVITAKTDMVPKYVLIMIGQGSACINYQNYQKYFSEKFRKYIHNRSL